MPDSGRAGVLIYAKHLPAVSSFYLQLLGATVVHSDVDHMILQTPDTQLIIHAIPPRYADAIDIQVPPVAREEQAIKPFFTVADLAEAERVTDDFGGTIVGPVWHGAGMRVRDVCDPEGNILQLRQSAD